MDTPGQRDELARLTLKNVDLRERRVLVEGKGRKKQYMYLGAVTTKAMTRYWKLRDALDPLTEGYPRRTGWPTGARASIFEERRCGRWGYPRRDADPGGCPGRPDAWRQLSSEGEGERCFNCSITGFNYGRVVGILYPLDGSYSLDEVNSVNVAMIEADWAYLYDEFGELYIGSRGERAACSKGVGLWQWGEDQVRPWDYRREMQQTASV